MTNFLKTDAHPGWLAILATACATLVWAGINGNWALALNAGAWACFAFGEWVPQYLPDNGRAYYRAGVVIVEVIGLALFVWALRYY